MATTYMTRYARRVSRLGDRRRAETLRRASLDARAGDIELPASASFVDPIFHQGRRLVPFVVELYREGPSTFWFVEPSEGLGDDLQEPVWAVDYRSLDEARSALDDWLSGVLDV